MSRNNINISLRKHVLFESRRYRIVLAYLLHMYFLKKIYPLYSLQASGFPIE